MSGFFCGRSNLPVDSLGFDTAFLPYTIYCGQYLLHVPDVIALRNHASRTLTDPGPLTCLFPFSYLPGITYCLEV